MNKPWEIYEKLNEMVFVTDAETYELVYMNKLARTLHGFQSNDELQGLKCYDVLTGCVCDFKQCNGAILDDGEFGEWVYYNPVLRKEYLIKETVIAVDGRRYHMELAIASDSWRESREEIDRQISHDHAINKGLRMALSAARPEDSIDIMLEYMGKTLRAERVYIFEERPGGVYSNTFEWCAVGMISQKDKLQSIPKGAMERWMNRFREQENIILRSVDSVRESDPRVYAYLQPQEIHSVVASPLLYENRIIGFYGVDNPPRHVMNNISELFTIIGYFIVLLLRRYEMVRRLERLSFHDELTDAGNRHAMDVYLEQIDDAKSLGAVYIDVTGLKMVNDTQGHRAGDALIVRACDCLREVFDGEHEALFRLGGDEFLVLCEGISKPVFLGKIAQFRALSAERSLVLAIGSAWSEEIDGNADRLIAQADSKMYEDKRNYYASEHDRRRN